MSFIRLKKRTAKISVNALILIIIFFTVGKINTINPKINPTNAIAKSTAAKIVSVVILFNFLIVNIYLFVFDDTNVCNIHNTKQMFNIF